MPKFLIKVKKARWENIPDFVPIDDVAADCVADLRIEGNSLSIWQVEDDQANVNRVLVALAARCQSVSNADYVLFDDSIPGDLGLRVQLSVGQTPDDHANGWHRDLVQLTGLQLVKLAARIVQTARIDRISEKRMAQLLREALIKGQLDQGRVDNSLAVKLQLGQK